MHLDDDGRTILYPYPTLYQCQQLQWRHRQKVWNRWIAFMATGLLGWVLWLV